MMRKLNYLPVVALAVALAGCSPAADIAAVEVPASPQPMSATEVDQPEPDRSVRPTVQDGAELSSRTENITSPPARTPTVESDPEQAAAPSPSAKGEFPAPPTGKPAKPPKASAFDVSPRANDSDAPAQLVGVVVGERNSWEELTFTFTETGTVPSYEVSYVDAVRPHAEADPVPLSGEAFLQVNFSDADPNTDGQLTIPSDLRPDQAQVKELVLAENLGGELRFGVGLAGRDGFHVRELESPTRLVIQFKSAR